jgi:hypothetical protein
MTLGMTSVVANAAPAFADANFHIYPNPTVLTTFGSITMTYQVTGLKPNSTYIIDDPIAGGPSCPVHVAAETDDSGDFALSLNGFPCEPGQSVATLTKDFGNHAIVGTFIHKVVAPRPTTDGTPCSGPRFFAAPGSRAPYPTSRATYPPALILDYSNRAPFNSFISKTLIGECLMPNVSRQSGTYTVTDPVCRINNAPVATDGMGRFYYQCNPFGVPPGVTSSEMYITQNPGNTVIVRNGEVMK